MNNYTKLFTDLVNVDVDIEEEDKVVILLISLSDEEYETFVLTLINGKQILNYSDVLAANVNYKVRRKENQSSFNGTSVEVLTTRDRSFNQKKKRRALEIKVQTKF